MKSIPPFNPFSAKSLESIPVLGTLLRNRAEQIAARNRMDKILSAYKEILNDKRYEVVLEDVRRAMREQLVSLVEKSSKCNHCMIHAMNVRMLQEVIKDPVEQVWYDAQRSRLEEESSGVL